MRHLPRIAEKLQWNWPQREAMYATHIRAEGAGLPKLFGTQMILSQAPYAGHGNVDLAFALLGFRFVLVCYLLLWPHYPLLVIEMFNL